MSSATSKNNSKAFKQTQFTWSYSHHGLSQMNDSATWCLWTFWLLLTIALLIPMVWNIYNSAVAFGKFSVNTKLSSERANSPPLPVVTICPKSPFKKYPFLEFINFYKNNSTDDVWARYPADATYYLDNVIGALDGNSVRDVYARPDSFLLHMFHFHPEWRDYISWECEDIFAYLRFMTAKDDEEFLDGVGACDEVEVVMDANHGRCFRLNVNQTAISVFSGPASGITMALKTNETDYVDLFDFLTTWSGFKIVLSSPDEELRVEENGRDLGLAQAVQIGIQRREIFKEQKWPWSDCITQYPEELQGLASTLKKKSYSKNACQLACLLERTWRRHNCVPFVYETLVPLGKIYSGPSCNYTYLISGVRNDLNGCNALCRPQCDTASWIQEVVTEPLPPVMEFEKYTLLAAAMGLTRVPFLTLKIFYSDLEITRVEEEPAKTPEALIGDIGGQLGLWCGMSIMTIFEVCILVYICCKKRRNAEVGGDSNEKA